MELDHFFILTESPAQHAAMLSDAGLVEGASNHHPGQGTSNRRFFFSNSVLELLYLRDAKEAETGPGRGLRFQERLSESGASPFGLVLKGSADAAAPFTGWCYQPDYFEQGRSFLIGDNSGLLAEPLCFYMPFEPPFDQSQLRSGKPFDTVSEVRIHVTVSAPSTVLDAVSRLEQISLLTDGDHLLELVFNDGIKGQVRDFRPALPLVIRC